MITLDSIIKKLTDVFMKDSNSNLGKLLTIMTEQLQAVEETQNRIREWRDIDKAQGTTLDRIGGNVGQPRGVATDEIYRILIKSKIARNLSTGDINTIIRVLSTALSTEPSEIRIQELYNHPTTPEPAAISVIQLPLKSVNEAGMSTTQLGRIVQSTVAAGVRVGVIELTGTFAFSSVPDESEYDNDAGLGDNGGIARFICDETIGGYLGAAYSPAQDEDLPI